MDSTTTTSVVAQEHECSCYLCRPELFPLPTDPARLGEHHVGVRFGDPGRGFWSVTVDGAEVGDVVEALAGQDGWVFGRSSRLVDAKSVTHLCACGLGVCSIFRRGVVAISLRGSSEDRQ